METDKEKKQTRVEYLAITKSSVKGKTDNFYLFLRLDFDDLRLSTWLL